MEHPCCKSHQGTRNSRRFLFRKNACHCTIRKFGTCVFPPPFDSHPKTWSVSFPQLTKSGQIRKTKQLYIHPQWQCSAKITPFRWDKIYFKTKVILQGIALILLTSNECFVMVLQVPFWKHNQICHQNRENGSFDIS